MLQRTGKKAWDTSITSGPGRVGKAFGFHTSQCGLLLTGNDLYIADDGWLVAEEEIVSSPRIGVDYAGEHAAWHYRFYLRDNPIYQRQATGKGSKEQKRPYPVLNFAVC
jgi:DNA-3-methyladenine glycosylase